MRSLLETARLGYSSSPHAGIVNTVKSQKRALNALGKVSEMCGILNGPKQIERLRASSEVAKSFEDVKV